MKRRLVDEGSPGVLVYGNLKCLHERSVSSELAHDLFSSDLKMVAVSVAEWASLSGGGRDGANWSGACWRNRGGGRGG